MFRMINSFNILKISVDTISNYSTLTYNPAFLPVKRCHRKPRWIPVAKSKRFKVPVKAKIPEDENKEILRLYNNYRNHIKSLRRYLTYKHCTMFQSSLDPDEILKHFKEDYRKCTELNDQWNAGLKAAREKRLEAELEEELDFAKKRIEQELIKEEQVYQLTEELVRKEKEASSSFITPENIDEAIEKALTETTDYNFSIDINGDKILGRETRPAQEKEEMSVKQ